MPYNATFDAQLEFLRQKVDLPTERWDDIWQEAHDQAFIVAGAQSADLLADLHAAIEQAIADGSGLEAFRKDFYRIVARHGWTGWTGEGSPAGIAWRTQVIYETNLSASYAAGRWQQLNDADLAMAMPYLRYKHADGVMHPRPLHVAWDGLTLPREHPFWRTHYPPNGWGCHCRATAASRGDYRAAVARGKGPDAAPAAGDTDGIDPGFAYAPGRSIADRMQTVIADKAQNLPTPIATDFKRAMTRNP